MLYIYIISRLKKDTFIHQFIDMLQNWRHNVIYENNVMAMFGTYKHTYSPGILLSESEKDQNTILLFHNFPGISEGMGKSKHKSFP